MVAKQYIANSSYTNVRMGLEITKHILARMQDTHTACVLNSGLLAHVKIVKKSDDRRLNNHHYPLYDNPRRYNTN